MRTSLAFSARTATSLIANFEAAIGHLRDLPSADVAAIDTVRRALDVLVREALVAPGRLPVLDNYLDELVAHAHDHLAASHPDAIARLQSQRAEADCDRCASGEPTCVALADNVRLIDSRAGCLTVIDTLVGEVFAQVRQLYPSPRGPLQIDTAMTVEAEVEGVDVRCDEERSTRRRLALDVIVDHDPRRFSLSFDGGSMYALPFVVVGALLQGPLCRIEFSPDGFDELRDGWLPYVAYRLVDRWCDSDVSRFPKSLRDRCADSADERNFDRRHKNPLVKRGEEAAIEMLALLRDAGLDDPVAELFELTAYVTWQRSNLDAAELIGLMHQIGSGHDRDQVRVMIRTYLKFKDHLSAVNHMIEFAQSFA